MRGGWLIGFAIVFASLPTAPVEASPHMQMRQLQMMRQQRAMQQQQDMRRMRQQSAAQQRQQKSRDVMAQSGKRTSDEQQRLQMQLLKEQGRNSREYKDVLDYEDMPDFNYWY